MMALRMEVFSLAFSHKFKKEKLLFQQESFTKNYIEENRQGVLWDTMLNYNKIIAQSGYDVVTGERMKRRWEAFWTVYKVESMKECESKKIDLVSRNIDYFV